MTERWNDAARDYYAVLECEHSANDDDLKRAYRRLALRWHPDKQTSAEERPRAELEFKLIAEAYACLRDPQARALYDQQRAANRDDEEVEVEAWPDEAAAADSRHRRTSRHGTSHHRHQHDRPRSNRDTVSPFDLFRELFGGPAFGGGAGPSFGTSLFDTFGQSPFESMSPFNNVRDLPFDIDSQFGALEDSLFGAPRDFPFGTPSWNLFGGNGRTHALPRDNGNPFRPLLRGHGVNIGSGSNASSVITQIINGRRTTTTTVTDHYGNTTTTRVLPDGTKEVLVNGVLQQRIAGSTAPLQQPGGDDETAIPVTIRH